MDRYIRKNQVEGDIPKELSILTNLKELYTFFFIKNNITKKKL